MDKNKIAVVGDPSSVMIFKAVGFDVFYEQERDQIKRRLHTLADEGYVVIYITEMAASLAADVIDEYATATFPAIIPASSSSTPARFPGLSLKNALIRRLNSLGRASIRAPMVRISSRLSTNLPRPETSASLPAVCRKARCRSSALPNGRRTP